ncbi:MAG: hypothetical protein K2W82_18110 [Candidatus Obscuribacterales bacterium]|nr:hypothetical protein [Candidatus Obscuribacterales bacterium]
MFGKFLKKNWRKLAALTLVTVLGCALVVAQKQLAVWESPQVTFYNEGLAFYNEGKVDEAMVAFDKSLDAYKAGRRREGWQKYVYPATSTEWAAEAHHKKAILYIMKQKAPQAIESFKESIKLNSGADQFRELTADQVKYLGEELRNMTEADIQRLDAKAKIVQYDLEMMFKKNPSMAAGEGKGKGKGKGQGQKPGQEPGEQPGGKDAGKGNRDDI